MCMRGHITFVAPSVKAMPSVPDAIVKRPGQSDFRIVHDVSLFVSVVQLCK